MAQCEAITSGESTLNQGTMDMYFAFQIKSVSSYNFASTLFIQSRICKFQSKFIDDSSLAKAKTLMVTFAFGDSKFVCIFNFTF